MNKELMLEAIEDAKKNNVQHIKGTYHEDGGFCMIGYLAYYMGIPKKNILRNHIVHPTGNGILHKVLQHYDIRLDAVNLVQINDELCRSWDDCIEQVKKYED